MGGIGSGTWERYDRKRTVEDSFTLSMHDFRGLIYPHASGTINWTFIGGFKASISFYISINDYPVINLRYRWNDIENIEIPIKLQSTPTNFEGKRWWFTCPLSLGGVACRRRVGKIYLPRGARYFGCRSCHDLTYQSCQEAHQREWLPSGYDQGR